MRRREETSERPYVFAVPPFFYFLKPQLSYVCPTPGQLPEDAQRLGVAEIDATAREQGMGQAGAGPGRGRCAPLCLERS